MVSHYIFNNNRQIAFKIDGKKVLFRLIYEMPLFTIHDSIITTSEYQTIHEEEFRKYLGLYFGLSPKLVVEEWNDDLSNAC